MTIFGLNSTLLTFVTVALVSGAVCFFLGFRNPGHKNISGLKNSYRWRQAWSVADIFAVTLTIVGVAKIVSPLISAEQSQVDNWKRYQGVSFQEDMIRAVDRAQDTFCPVAGLDKGALVTCDVIRKVQRSVYAPRVNYITAEVILKDYLPLICTEEKCDSLIADIKQKATNFYQYSLSIRNLVDNPHPTTENDIRYLLGFTFLYILIGSFRLGRSGAEFSRNRLDYEAEKAKVSAPGTKEEKQTAAQKSGTVNHDMAFPHHDGYFR